MTTNGKVDRTALPPPTRNGWASSGPRDEVEQVLAAIWSDTLGIEGIGPGSDFFEMGGDSLLAVELLERVSVHFGDELEISDIFGTPTLGALAARLRHGHPPEASPLVPIRPLGCVLPFFCAAPVLGTVFPYYDLAHHLDPERPFYGLQPGCWPNEQGATVASLAAHYLPAVRRVQPEGPYHLGGWSFGGLVAFEMARQLKADGESVAATVLLDTPAPSERERLDLAEATRFILGTAGRGIAPYARDYEYLLDRTRRSQTGRGRRLSMSGFLRWIAERAAIAGIVPPESRLLLYHPPTVRQMVRSFRNGLVAGARYRPEPFEGRITLIRTSELGNPTMGWDRLARDGVDVRYVPGDHMSLLRQPHVAALARTLQVILDAREHDGAHHKTERAI